MRKTMNKKNKYIALLAGSAVLLGGSAFAMQRSVASADGEVVPPETTTVFEMDAGVSLPLYDNGGLRWLVKMDADTAKDIKETDKELYFIISNRTNFDAAKGNYYALVDENNTYALNVQVEENKIYLENGSYWANGCVFGILEANYQKDYCAVAYIKDGENITYADVTLDDISYDQYDILNAAVFDSVVGDYTDDIFALSAYDWFGTESYPIKVTKQADYDKMINKINDGANYSDLHVEVADGIDLDAVALGTDKTLPANTTVSYKVEHYTQNVINDNYTLAQTVTKTDKIGATVTATAETIENQTYDANNADGVEEAELGLNTTLKCYYSRDNIKEIRGVEKADGKYTAKEAGNNKAAYYYEDLTKKGTVAVYSVKVKVDAVPTSSGGSIGLAGITLTNQVESTGGAKAYQSIFIGINQIGLASVRQNNEATAGKTRYYGATVTNYYEGTGADTENLAFTSAKLERTLTVILQADVLYMYVDGAYIASVATTNDNYFDSNCFTAGSEYTFGVGGYQIQHWENGKPVIEVITEKYGTAAEEEILKNYFYGMTPSSGKVFDVQSGKANWQGGGLDYKVASAYTNPTTYATTAVYSVKINIGYISTTENPVTTLKNTGEGVPQLLGIRFSNRGGQSAVVGISSDGIVGYTHKGNPIYTKGNSDGSAFGMSRRFDLGDASRWTMTGSSSLSENIAFVEGVTERTLTMVLQNDRMSIYVGNTLVKDLSIAGANTSDNLQGYWQCFTANQDYRFGIVATQLDQGANTAKFTVVNELYGDEAATYIAANYA